MLTCTYPNDKESFIRYCKSIIEELNKPEYIVYGSQDLPEDMVSFLKYQKCEYRYVAPRILGAPESTFYVLPSKMLDDYYYKMED